MISVYNKFFFHCNSFANLVLAFCYLLCLCCVLFYYVIYSNVINYHANHIVLSQRIGIMVQLTKGFSFLCTWYGFGFWYIRDCQVHLEKAWRR